MAHDLLNTYSELADVISNLGLIVRERRRQSRLSVRAAAAEIGISFSTISRLERGSEIEGRSLAAVLRWLDAPVALAAVRSFPSPGAGASGGTQEAQEGSQ